MTDNDDKAAGSNQAKAEQNLTANTRSAKRFAFMCGAVAVASVTIALMTESLSAEALETGALATAELYRNVCNVTTVTGILAMFGTCLGAFGFASCTMERENLK